MLQTCRLVRTGQEADQDEDNNAVELAEQQPNRPETGESTAGRLTGPQGRRLTRTKTTMLLTWQKWQIQPTGTTSSIRFSQLLVTRLNRALASVLPGIHPVTAYIPSYTHSSCQVAESTVHLLFGQLLVTKLNRALASVLSGIHPVTAYIPPYTRSTCRVTVSLAAQLLFSQLLV